MGKIHTEDNREKEEFRLTVTRFRINPSFPFVNKFIPANPSFPCKSISGENQTSPRKTFVSFVAFCKLSRRHRCPL